MTQPTSTQPQEKLVKAMVPADLVDRLREQARTNDRSLAAEVRQALRKHLEAAA